MFLNPHLMEQPNWGESAHDSAGFSGQVFGGLLKQPRVSVLRLQLAEQLILAI